MKNKIILSVVLCTVLLFGGCEKSERNALNDNSAPAAESDAKESGSEKENDPADNESDFVQIAVTWDEADVTYKGDPAMYDVSSNEVCAPILIIEGEGVTSESNTEGTVHTEKITVPNDADFVSERVEPSAPTNNCPLDTVKISVTKQDGSEDFYDFEDKRKRGQTGIWYVDVYERP
ncbi:MAG: hypothetical protein IJ736_04055 [Firmicutes bacterium]|nr:hypothetical protein [Bacillota bacterium]